MLSPLDQVRQICMALPDVTEKVSHGEPMWFVKNRGFASFADHHHNDRVAIWCAAPEGAQAMLISTGPELFFRPPYVGPRGWVGVYLDVEVDWTEVAEVLQEAHACISAKTSRRR